MAVETLCYSCATDSAFKKCLWVHECIPVKGWTAEETTVNVGANCVKSYRVIECPNYVVDRRDVSMNRICIICGKKHERGSAYCGAQCYYKGTYKRKKLTV